MKKTPTTITLLALVAGVGLLASGYFLYNYHSESQRNMELERKLIELTKQEQQSTVMQRVNAQMEEIANEQRRISDEQRKAAEEQTMVAEQERQNAEQQRQQAVQERQNALLAEHKAIEASKIAQQERSIAEQQRSEAEYSKSVADTLSYIALARSLGNTAITQFRAGNQEIADMLAFTATLYTARYHSDIYSPSVYQSLAMTSQNKSAWNKHKGSITDIAFISKDANDFVSCSTYGEVLRHHLKGSNLQTETLVKDSKFDFRDIYVERTSETIYAVSRTSELVVIKDNKVERVIQVNIPKLIKLEPVGKEYILFGEQGIACFDATRNMVVKEKNLPFKVVSINLQETFPLIFDDKGYQHMVRSFDKIETSKVPYSGQVTAFAESKNEKIKAYGMSDGTIYYVDKNGKTTKLSGHRSRISKIKINGLRIYSSSYDGTLNLWLANMSKMDPMPLFTTSGWIINFTYDPMKINIWTGDQKGNLTEALISVSKMIERLKNKLKRNFTQDEWNYYIGNNVPYENIKGKEVHL